jgi:sulfur relay (sulfurtransferase) DsrF/TusC family protein
MPNDILIVIRHGPYGGFQAAEGLRHTNGALSLGFRPVLVLVDDGAYLAQAGQEPGESQWISLSETLEAVIARGLYEKRDAPAEFYVDEASLRERGLSADDLVESLVPVGREKLSALWAEHRFQMLF